jgi:ATP-dependent Clp protease ATP-binding subunit ClpC
LLEARKNVLIEAKKIFKPEFVNRLDEIIIFRPLSKQNNMQIARLELKNLADRLKAQGISIKCTPKVLEFLVNKGTDTKNGARFLKRTIQKNIEDEISLMIISQKVKSGQTIKIIKKADKLLLTAVNQCK